MFLRGFVVVMWLIKLLLFLIFRSYTVSAIFVYIAIVLSVVVVVIAVVIVVVAVVLLVLMIFHVVIFISLLFQYETVLAHIPM